MSENFDKLKSIGIQKIHEVTHIPRVHIESLFNENFENMNSTQLSGFIYVLEREYMVDLSDLKKRSADYFQNNKATLKKENNTLLFRASKKKRNYTLIYIVLASLLFLLFAYFNMQPTENELSRVDNSTIQNAKNAISMAIDDKNKTEENSTLANKHQDSLDLTAQHVMMQNAAQPLEELKSLNSIEVAQEPTKQEVIKTNTVEELNSSSITVKEDTQKSVQIPQQEALKSESFKIIAINSVWLGYIDLSNNKKYQKTFTGEFELDATKNWLLALGHGTVDIELNGVVTKYRKLTNIRFSYIDSKLKEIDGEEFKTLNKGEKW